MRVRIRAARPLGAASRLPELHQLALVHHLRAFTARDQAIEIGPVRELVALGVEPVPRDLRVRGVHRGHAVLVHQLPTHGEHAQQDVGRTRAGEIEREHGAELVVERIRKRHHVVHRHARIHHERMLANDHARHGELDHVRAGRIRSVIPSHQPVAPRRVARGRLRLHGLRDAVHLHREIALGEPRRRYHVQGEIRIRRHAVAVLQSHSVAQQDRLELEHHVEAARDAVAVHGPDRVAIGAEPQERLVREVVLPAAVPSHAGVRERGCDRVLVGRNHHRSAPIGALEDDLRQLDVRDEIRLELERVADRGQPHRLAVHHRDAVRGRDDLRGPDGEARRGVAEQDVGDADVLLEARRHRVDIARERMAIASPSTTRAPCSPSCGSRGGSETARAPGER